MIRTAFAFVGRRVNFVLHGSLRFDGVIVLDCN